MNIQIKTWIGIMIIILVALVSVVFVWYQQKKMTGDGQMINYPTPNQKACTEEAKLCPDGSYVSRTGPKCEFAPCPETIGISDKLIILTPAKDTVITSPVSISGRARGTWFFEGSFPVEVYDSNNKLLGTSTAKFVPKSENETWMTENFVDFSGEIKFSQSAIDTGYILFKKDNPSGLAQNDESYKLPVKFSIPDNEIKADAQKCYSELTNLQGTGAYMPNPASVFCKCMGGVGGVVTAADGGQSGTCTVDGKTYDEWEYFHKMNPNSNL